MFLLLQNVEWQPPHFKCHFVVLCPPLFLIRSHQSLSIFSYMKYECVFLPPYFQDFLHLIFSTFSHIYYSDSWICKLVFFKHPVIISNFSPCTILSLLLLEFELYVFTISSGLCLFLNIFMFSLSVLWNE